MQYKIPINIENEDPIIFIFSIRQIIISATWWWLWYAIYNSISGYIWITPAALLGIIIFWISIFIALFKYSEMSFTAMLLNMIRIWVNQKERYWIKWIDSFSALDIWYITNNKQKMEKINFWNKIEKIKNIEEQLEKI